MTTACTIQETIVCHEIMAKNSIDDSNTRDDELTKNNSLSVATNVNEEDEEEEQEKDETLENTQTCTRQLAMYLESRGIQAWNENYTYIDEASARASTSSLESHEMISDVHSSGYNSSEIDCARIKCKRDSDSLSASSQSDSGEINCIAVQNHHHQHDDDDDDDDESSALNNTLHELERSMVEILKSNLHPSVIPESSSVMRKVAVKNCQDGNYDSQDNVVDFHAAVRKGDTKQVARLVTCGFIEDLNEPDWNVSGDPPLLVAATNHCLPLLSLLLSSGCDPGVRSPRGETALHRAILNGGPGNAFKFVEKLLQYGCSPGVKEAGGGLTALHILARQLSHSQSTKNSLHYNFDEALETLAILAKAGAVNDKDHQGRSALHILASSTIFDNNHRSEIESLIRILLEAGADPMLKNDRGETPLDESLECGALITAELLMPHTPAGIISRYGETPLHIAARKNYIEIVRKLLENGEDPGLQDAEGNTPLHLASARGFHQIVSLLVTSTLVQLEKVNDNGLTALQVAAESGFINAVTLLLKAGADLTLIMTKRATLHQRHPDISMLIDHESARRRQLAT